MKINLSDTISYYLYDWDIKDIKEIISTSYEISQKVNSTYDGHGIWKGVQSEDWIKEQKLGHIGNLILKGIQICKEIYKEEYESVSSSSWINIINASKPKQNIRNLDGTLVYHTHTEISNRVGTKTRLYIYILYSNFQTI